MRVLWCCMFQKGGWCDHTAFNLYPLIHHLHINQHIVKSSFPTSSMCSLLKDCTGPNFALQFKSEAPLFGCLPHIREWNCGQGNVAQGFCCAWFPCLALWRRHYQWVLPYPSDWGGNFLLWFWTWWWMETTSLLHIWYFRSSPFKLLLISMCRLTWSYLFQVTSSWH